MTEDVPPLSKVPGYRPPSPAPDDPPQPGVPTMDLLESTSSRWGPELLAIVALVLSLIVVAIALATW